FAAVRQILKFGLSIDGGIPIDRIHNPLDFGRALASGIHAADQAAHAGSGDIVYRDLMLLQPLENRDVSKSERSATLENQTDTRTVFRRASSEREKKNKGAEDGECPDQATAGPRTCRVLQSEDRCRR